MADDNRYTIIIKGILEKDLGKKLQTQLDALKDISIKITKFEVDSTAISNLKKTIEAGLSNINVGVTPTSKGGTTTGGSGTTTGGGGSSTGVSGGQGSRYIDPKEINFLLRGGKFGDLWSEKIPVRNTTYYLDEQKQLQRLTELYQYLTGVKTKYNFVVGEEGELLLNNITINDNVIKTYDNQVKLLDQATKARVNLQRTIESSPTRTTEEYQKATEQVNALESAMHDVEEYLYGGGKQPAPFELQEKLKDATNQANLLKTSLGDTNREWRSMQSMVDEASELSYTMTENMKKRSESVPEVRKAITQSNLLGKMAGEYNDQLAKGIPLTEEQTKALSAQYVATDKARAAVNSMGKDTIKFSQEIGVAIKRTIEWSLAMGAVYGSINQIKQGIAFINDLDESLTNIRIVSGMTAEETQNLAQQYNNLAKELGSTTQAVAQGSLEFIRQGKTIAETNELLRVSTMMSKLGDMEATQATEIVTSIMNGFNLEASDMMSVLDKLTQADNMAASSILEIGTALQRTSVSARLAGVSFDEMVAMITTVSEVTRKSSETIGESFKTIFSRYQNVTMGKDVDEFGESLNNVEEVLKKNDISIRNSQGHFRDFGDVLEEVAAKWDTLGNEERSEIATQLGSVRQRENVLVLMDNYNRYKEIEVAMTDKAGLAQERYGIYLDSVEAKTNQLKATWEEFWLKSFNSETTKRVLDIASAVLQLGTRLGGLGDILKIVAGLFLVLNSANIAGLFINVGKSIKSTTNAMLGLTVATQGATKAQIALQAAMGWVGLALIIGEAVYQVIKYVTWINSAAKAQEDLNAATDKFNQSRLEFETEIQNREDLTELLQQYDELSNKVNKTAKETEEWFEVNRRIHEILPKINGYYDESGRFIIDSSLDLKTILDLETKILEAKYKQYELDKQTNIDAQREVVTKLQEELDKALAHREDMLKLQQVVSEEQDSVMGMLGQAQLLQSAAAAGMLDPADLDKINAEIERLSLKLQQAKADLGLMTGEVEDLGQASEDGTISVSNLRGALNAMANFMRSEYKDGFAEFSRSVLALNDAFEKGEISAKAYFETLAEKASNADIIGMFEGNASAAQTFFKALFIEGLQAIDILDTRMQEGKISILEYMDGLQGTSDVLREQYESLLENADAYGLNAEQIANITSSYEEMTSALSSSNQELSNMRGTAELLFAGYDAVMSGTMKSSSEEMIAYYEQLSQAAWDYAQQSGFAFKDSEGQALSSAKAIYDYLSGGVGNFNNFASQMTKRANLAVEQQKIAIANVVQSLAKTIGSIEVSLEAYSDDTTTIQFPLPKIIGDVFKVDSFPITIPNIKMSGGVSVGNQEALGSLTGGLQDLISGGGYQMPAFDNSIWSGGGGYQTPSAPGGGGGGGGGTQADDARNEAEKAYQDLLKMTIAMLKDRAKQAQEALREELKAYKDLINQKKDDLNLMREQRKEQDKIDEARENITSIEEEIAQLQFDTSEEGIARRLELEQQLAEERKALEDEQFDQSIDAQIRALDEEYENYQDYIDQQIAALEDYLEKEGEITQEAMELIHGRTEEFYNELMEWNMTYGSGVAQDVVNAWQGAIVWIDTFAMQGAEAVEGFASRAGAAVSGVGSAIAAAAESAETSMANATSNMSRSIDNTFARLNSLLAGFITISPSQMGLFNRNIPLEYHEGGIVGSMPTLPESEVFAKLLKGEYVATEGEMYNFVNKTLPSIAGASNSKSIGDISIIFDVENLDRDVLPDIKNMVTKAINDTLVDAGFKRNPGSFGSI